MALRLHGDGHLVALGRVGLGEGNGAVRILAHLRLNGVGGGSGAAATATGGAGANGQLAVLIADGVVVGGRRAAGKDLDLAGLGHVGGDFLAVRADVLHRRLGRQFLLAHQTGNGAAVRPQRGGLVAHIGGLILGLDGNSLLPHRQGAGHRRLVIILRGGRLGGDDRRARALDGDLAGCAVHLGNRRRTALVGHGAALDLTGSGEGEVPVTVGLGHAAVLKLEVGLLILGGGRYFYVDDVVRIVVAGDLTVGVCYFLHYTFVISNGEGENAAIKRGVFNNREIIVLTQIAQAAARHDPRCQIHRFCAADLRGNGNVLVSITRLSDGDFLCGAGNVLIVIAAGLGRGDGHRARLRGMQLAAVNDRRLAGAVRYGVGHRAVAAAAISGQRQVCAVGRVSGGHGQRGLLGLGDGGLGDRQHLGGCQRIVAGGDSSGGKDNLLCLVNIGAVVFQRAADSEGIAAHQRIVLHRNGEAAGGIGAAVIDLGDRAGMDQIILRQRLGCDGEIRRAGVDLDGSLILHLHGVAARVGGNGCAEIAAALSGIGDRCLYTRNHIVPWRFCVLSVGPVVHADGNIRHFPLGLERNVHNHRNNRVVLAGQIDRDASQRCSRDARQRIHGNVQLAFVPFGRFYKARVYRDAVICRIRL